MQLNKHPVIRQVYELCQAIETFPASPEQTALVIKASALGDEIEKFVDAKGLRCDYLPDATYFLDQDRAAIKPLEQRQNACRVELWAALEKRRTQVVDLAAVGKQLVATYGASVTVNLILNEWEAASQRTDWQTKVCDVVWLQTQTPYVQDMSWLLCYHKEWDGSK